MNRLLALTLLLALSGCAEYRANFLASFGLLPSDIRFVGTVLVSRQQDQVRVTLETRNGKDLAYTIPEQHRFSARAESTKRLALSPYASGTYFADFAYEDTPITLTWEAPKEPDVQLHLPGLPEPFLISRLGTLDGAFIIEWTALQKGHGLSQQEIYIYEHCYGSREPSILEAKVIHQAIIGRRDTAFILPAEEFDIRPLQGNCAYFAHVSHIYDQFIVAPPSSRYERFSLDVQHYEHAGPVRF